MSDQQRAGVVTRISRAQAERMIRNQMARSFDENTVGGKQKACHSVGRMEFAELLDEIYGPRETQHAVVSGVRALSGEFCDLETDDQIYLCIRRADIWSARGIQRWDHSEPQDIARATWRAMCGLAPNNTYTWHPNPSFFDGVQRELPPSRTYPGVERLTQEDIAELAALARKIGGWIDLDYRFVPMDEWRAEIGCGLPVDDAGPLTQSP